MREGRGPTKKIGKRPRQCHYHKRARGRVMVNVAQGKEGEASEKSQDGR